MPLVRDTMILAFGVLGAVCASQAPEFAQQYRQRLGGALDELRQFVADFDADAAKSGLTRSEALEAHRRSVEPLFQDRGGSMQTTIAREQALQAQADWFAELPPVARPLALARNYDERLMAGAWQAFEPAVPLTPHGAAWAAMGFGLGALATMLLARVFRFRPGRAKKVATSRRR